MMLLKKAIAGSVVAVGVITGYSYYKRLKRTREDLQIIPTASIYELNWQEIVIRIDVILKNPSKGSFSIKFPFISLSYKDATVANSQVINQDIKIPAQGEAIIQKILLKVPLASIFSVSTDLLKAIQSKQAITVNAAIKTTIKLGLLSVPYTYKKDLILK